MIYKQALEHIRLVVGTVLDKGEMPPFSDVEKEAKNVLPVPYISQLEKDAEKYNNDCGAAAGLMLLQGFGKAPKMTVDEFYLLTGVTHDVYLSASQIMTVLRKNGVPSVWQTGMNMGGLRQAIEAGKPVIALINYAVFRRAIQTETQFAGEHFLVVVGIDNKNVIVNDPLWHGTGGKELSLTHNQFLAAWTASINHGNPARGGIIPLGSIFDKDINPIGTVRVLSRNGVKVRTQPSIRGEDTGLRLKYNSLHSVYRKSGDWVSLNANGTEWSAVSWSGIKLMKWEEK